MKQIKSIIAILLVAAFVLSFAACADKSEAPGEESSTEIEAPESAPEASEEGSAPADKVEAVGIWASAVYRNDTVFGEGTKTVEVEVKAEDRSVTFTVKTDSSTLGEALLAHGLIDGEQGAYGLYIKSVNGMVADYDIDQTYWAFYKNGEMMMTGVDGAEISGGEHFELVRTK